MAGAFARERLEVAAVSAGKAAWWAANGLLARRIARPASGAAPVHVASDALPPDMKALRRAWFEAFQKDARDVGLGLYPASETLPQSPMEPWRRAADFLADVRAVDRRRRGAGGAEVRDDAGGHASYPPYYRQNFHFQTGGWFTAESAARYEAQVEALFSGAAGPMRRRALSLLAGALRSTDQRRLRILDLACGSGAFLRDVRTTFPRAAVFGLDLSLPYLLEARRRSGAAQVLGAAERLPFADASLDAVTCVYLFHELPPKVRLSASVEIARVLRPGGRLAFADSVQRSDVPDVARLLDAFPVFFHEPYFQSYQDLDLAALFGRAGLISKGSDQAFLTKALLFEKT